MPISSSHPLIAVDQLAQRLGAPELRLVDCRFDLADTDAGRRHYRTGHIPGAVNIPHDELVGRLAELPADKSAEVVVYCHGGPRAWRAEQTLKENGYSSVQDLSGQWLAWQAAGLPGE